MYFEFEDNFKGEGFLRGLLWGGDKPTQEHPEEYFTIRNILIIWSFKKGSQVPVASKKRLKAVFKGISNKFGVQKSFNSLLINKNIS